VIIPNRLTFYTENLSGLMNETDVSDLWSLIQIQTNGDPHLGPHALGTENRDLKVTCRRYTSFQLPVYGSGICHFSSHPLARMCHLAPIQQ
jgi:hypothetical protein